MPMPSASMKEFFLGHAMVFLLDFLFQDLGILNRISLKKNWPEVVPESQ